MSDIPISITLDSKSANSSVDKLEKDLLALEKTTSSIGIKSTAAFNKYATNAKKPIRNVNALAASLRSLDSAINAKKVSSSLSSISTTALKSRKSIDALSTSLRKIGTSNKIASVSKSVSGIRISATNAAKAVDVLAASFLTLSASSTVIHSAVSAILQLNVAVIKLSASVHGLNGKIAILNVNLARLSATSKTSFSNLNKGFHDASSNSNRFSSNVVRDTTKIAGGFDKALNRALIFGELLETFLSLHMFALLIGDVTRAVTELTAMNNALLAIEGSLEGAGKASNFLSTISQKLGADFKVLNTEYVKFAAAGKESKSTAYEIRDAFAAIAETSVVLNLRADETHGILKAVTQMMSKGKVQAEELRGQLGEHLPGAFEIVAKGMGKTTAELDDMLKSGKIMSEELIQILPKALRDAYGKALPAAMETGRAEMARFNNDINLYLNENRKEFDATYVEIAKGFRELFIALRRSGFITWLNEVFASAGKLMQNMDGLINAIRGVIETALLLKGISLAQRFYAMATAGTELAMVINSISTANKLATATTYSYVAATKVANASVLAGTAANAAAATTFAATAASVGGLAGLLQTFKSSWSNVIMAFSSSTGTISAVSLMFKNIGSGIAGLLSKMPLLGAAFTLVSGPIGIFVGIMTSLVFAFRTFLDESDKGRQRMEDLANSTKEISAEFDMATLKLRGLNAMFKETFGTEDLILRFNLDEIDRVQASLLKVEETRSKLLREKSELTFFGDFTNTKANEINAALTENLVIRNSLIKSLEIYKDIAEQSSDVTREEIRLKKLEAKLFKSNKTELDIEIESLRKKIALQKLDGDEKIRQSHIDTIAIELMTLKSKGSQKEYYELLRKKKVIVNLKTELDLLTKSQKANKDEGFLTGTADQNRFSRFADDIKELNIQVKQGEISQKAYKDSLIQVKNEYEDLADKGTNYSQVIQDMGIHTAEFANQAKAIAADVATPLEVMTTELSKLKTIYESGAFESVGGLETYQRAQKKIIDNFEDAKNSTDDWSKFTERAAENMQDAFADFLFDPFDEGLDGMFDSFEKTLRKMAAEMAAQEIMNMASGFFGMGGSGSSGGGGGWDFVENLTGMAAGFFGGGGLPPVIGPSTSGIQSVASLGGGGPTAGFANMGSMFGGMRAAGGPVTGNDIYAVGEKGPELFVPKSNGTIIPNNVASGISSNNGSRTIITNHITVTAPEGRLSRESMGQLQQKIGTGIDRSMRRNS